MFIIKLQGGHENAKLIEVASDVKIMSQRRLSLSGKTEWDSHKLQQRNKERSFYIYLIRTIKADFHLWFSFPFTYAGKTTPARLSVSILIQL